MSFFDSELVRAEMTEISILQDDIYQNMLKFPTMTNEEKKFYICLFEKLLEKQRILYARLSLSEDLEAIEFRNKIKFNAVSLGLGFTDINSIFNNMESMINAMKDIIDKNWA